jgi:hypothetical protein
MADEERSAARRGRRADLKFDHALFSAAAAQAGLVVKGQVAGVDGGDAGGAGAGADGSGAAGGGIEGSERDLVDYGDL